MTLVGSENERVNFEWLGVVNSDPGEDEDRERTPYFNLEGPTAPPSALCRSNMADGGALLKD